MVKFKKKYAVYTLENDKGKIVWREIDVFDSKQEAQEYITSGAKDDGYVDIPLTVSPTYIYDTDE